MKQKENKPKIHICYWSGGKDSMATILLALEHNEPLDRVVFAEVMFDHEKGISGETPEHIEWIYNTAIPKLESMGVKVDVVRGERDYKYFFSQVKSGRGKHAGKISGYPIAGRCCINRDCKMKPVRDYYKQFKEDYDIVCYVGIAIDEPTRLTRLRGTNKVSLLEKYDYTEEMAYELCKRNGLLSPLYEIGNRGGCFFCPNAKIREFIHLRKNHPDIWQEMKDLSKTPNLCSYLFLRDKTFEEVERKMDIKEWEDQQPTLFDFI